MFEFFRSKGWAIALLATLAAAASAYPPEGKYREEIKNPFRGQFYTLVRTLHLRIGGKAEMYFEYKGDKPVVDLLVKDEYGALMEVVANFRKLKHSGTWKPSAGGRIYVELTRLEAGDESGNLHSAIEFELFSNELVARKQDTGDYGDQTMRFKLLEPYQADPAAPPAPGGGAAVPIPPLGGNPAPGAPLIAKKLPEPGAQPDFDPSRRKGSYAWAEEVPAQEGASLLVRRLKLNGDRSAELISEYLGRKPRLDAGSPGRYGVLFAEVVANRKITHRGSWKESDGRVLVDLDRIGGGDFAQNVRSQFLLDPSGSDLDVRELDQGDYGNRPMRFRKDFNPSTPKPPDSPEDRPNRPDPEVKAPKTLEMDVSASGNGFASLQDHKPREITQVRLILRRDGRFEIRAKAGDDILFRGDYQIRNERQIDIRVAEAFGETAAAGGNIDFGRSGAVQKIVIRGTARGKRLTVTFNAR